MTLPPSLYAPGIDAGGIGVAVVVRLPLSGPALHRRRRRSNLADREDWALFTDSLVVDRHNEDHRHQRAAYRSSLFILAAAVAGTVMARMWGIYNRSS